MSNRNSSKMLGAFGSKIGMSSPSFEVNPIYWTLN